MLRYFIKKGHDLCIVFFDTEISVKNVLIKTINWFTYIAQFADAAGYGFRKAHDKNKVHLNRYHYICSNEETNSNVSFQHVWKKLTGY